MHSSEQKSAHFHTWEHIHQVQEYLAEMQKMLLQRMLTHDLSKIYDAEEMAAFAELPKKLDVVPYGSREYREILKDAGPAIRAHQEKNPHHPEAHEGGIAGMTLIDLCEMLCDWKAAGARSKNGCLHKSLEIQKNRLSIDDQLFRVLKNTAALFDKQES